MNKTIWIIILIVLVVLAAWLLTSNTEVPVDDAMNEEETEITEEDSIEGQLEGINVEDVESEFDQVDEDLESVE